MFEITEITKDCEGKLNNIDKNQIIKLIIIGMLCSFTSFNEKIDIIINLIILIILMMDIKKDKFYYYFSFLMFFENQLQLPFGLGTIIRPYFCLILLKFIINRNKIKVNYLFLITPLIITDLYLMQIGNYKFTIIINSVLILIIHSKTISSRDMIKQELFYLGFATLFFGLFGIIHNRFIVQDVTVSGEYSLFKRFSGAINDPNYSALVFNMGIISFLFLNNFTKKYFKIICIIILYIFLFLTVSIEGISGNILLISIYFLYYLKKKKHVKLIKFIKIIPFLILIIILISKTMILNPYILRAKSILQSNGNYAKITSNRSEIGKIYLNMFIEDFSISEKLFGGEVIIGDDNIKQKYVSIVGNVSHNTYLDILFSIGIIGMIIIFIEFIRNIFLLWNSYRKNKDEVYLAIVFLKLLILYTGCGLSLFPLRYWMYVYIF